jgi:DNA-binding transcriptional regulator YhcF (GntR family)
LSLFKEDFVFPLVKEAKNLGFNKEDIVKLIGKEIDNEVAN